MKMKHNQFLKFFALLFSPSFLCPLALDARVESQKSFPQHIVQERKPPYKVIETPGEAIEKPSEAIETPSEAIEKPSETTETPCAEQEKKPVTLQETLELTYMQNATLDAARAGLRVTAENVSIANADWRPSIGIEAFQNFRQVNPIDGHGTPRTHTFTTSYTATITQNIYKGGATDATIGQRESEFFAGKGGLFSTEQTVLLNAVTAHANVIATQDIVKYLQDSVSFYKTFLEETRARFEVGEKGRTDVEAALSQYEQSKGDLSTAVGDLQAAKAAYLQIVGCPPDNLEPANIILELPETYDEALCIAQAQNPTIVEARYQLEAALYNVDIQLAGLLPVVDVSGNVGNDRQGGTGFPFVQKQTVLGGQVDLSVPIYRQGIPSAQVRQAYQAVSQSKVELVQTQRVVEQDARTAWENLIAARGALKGYLATVKAGELAVEGATAEVDVGEKSVIDVIVLQRDLIQAQIDLVRAQQTLITSSYAVLQAMGSLMASVLKLNVQYYDPDVYYEEYKDAWIKFWNLEDMRYVRFQPCTPLCKTPGVLTKVVGDM